MCVRYVWRKQAYDSIKHLRMQDLREESLRATCVWRLKSMRVAFQENVWQTTSTCFTCNCLLFAETLPMKLCGRFLWNLELASFHLCWHLLLHPPTSSTAPLTETLRTVQTPTILWLVWTPSFQLWAKSWRARLITNNQQRKIDTSKRNYEKNAETFWDK